MQIRIIIFLGIYITAQQAETDAQALPLCLILCLTLLDTMLVIWTGKGIINYLKKTS